MRLPRILLLLAGLLPFGIPASAMAAPSSVTMWTLYRGTTVYAAPAPDAAVLARIPGNLPLSVTVVGAWGRTLLWNALPAWVPLSGLVASPQTRGYVPGPATPIPTAIAQAPQTLTARLRLIEPAYLRSAPLFSAPHVTLLHAGIVVTTTSWAISGAGQPWYRVAAPAGAGWVYGGAVAFAEARPPATPAQLAPLRGKGMWLTYPVLRTSPVSAIVRAARAAHLTHLYVEVARSGQGFYGGPGLAALLPAAHHAGIRVIAWVYPFLRDVSSDIVMSLAAARYVAPSGDRPDGLLADVEDNMSGPVVDAYGGILRAALGPRALMAVATFPPQSFFGQAYPFAVVARDWDVIVPMDYWHELRRAYTPGEVYDYVRRSVALIRTRTRPDMPVEVLGQTFDRFESGVNSPSGAEIAACIAAARDSHALGVGFFEWNHATLDEWGAIGASD